MDVRRFNQAWSEIEASVRSQAEAGKESTAASAVRTRKLSVRLGELRNTEKGVGRHMNVLHHAFLYYGTLVVASDDPPAGIKTGDNPSAGTKTTAGAPSTRNLMTVPLSTWMQFCADGKLVDKSEKGASSALELKRIFLATAAARAAYNTSGSVKPASPAARGGSTDLRLSQSGFYEALIQVRAGCEPCQE